MAKPNIVLTGNHRDIPLSLGMMIISWNACEEQLRYIIKVIVARGDYRAQKLVEILTVEMGTLALEQALESLTHEFPEHSGDLAAELRFAVSLVGRLKTYRNYYTHAVSGITQYGIDWNNDKFEQDLPISAYMTQGPFAQLYQKTAKGKPKWAWEFVSPQELVKFTNHIADTADYLRDLSLTVTHYMRRIANWRESAPLPQRPPLPAVLAKRVLDHPKLKLPPALDLSDLPQKEEGEED